MRKALMVFLGTAALASCRPDYPLCKSDDHCKEHSEVCVEGQCRECATDAQCKSGFACKDSRCEPKAAAAPTAQVEPPKPAAPAPTEVAGTGALPEDASARSSCELKKIHFAFDDSTLDEPARQVLSDAADCIRRKRFTRVIVEGHADDRGTAEYNIALGQRRAESVKKYLADLGVDPKGMETLSWGEEKPDVAGTDESSHAKNRRSELKPSGQ